MKFINKEDRVYSFNPESREEIFLFEDIIIKELIKNVNTGDIKANLSFCFGGEKTMVSVSRNTYQTKKGLLTLQDKGVDVTEENAKQMVEYLKRQEKKIEIKRVHNKLGYDNKSESFLIYESIPKKSVYDGELDLIPKGTLDDWMKMYNKYIKGRKELEFIVLVGLSSALIGMIGKEVSIENPIVHIYGDSSTGKTTAVQLALSSWGNPSLRVNGIMQTFNETINSLMHNLNNNNGIPMCFDEISMSSVEDFTSFIYSVSNGKEKGRLINEVGKGYVKSEQRTWNTVIVSTGEYNILERAKENDGLKVRVYAIGGVQWTKDSYTANQIKNYIHNNYGHLGYLFASKLIQIGQLKMIQIYEKNLEKIIKTLKERKIYDDFTERRAKYYSILMLVGSILNLMEFNIKLKEIFSIIQDIERNSIKERNVSKQAYDKLIEYVSKNRRRFPMIESKMKRTISNRDDVWGYVLRKEMQVEIFPENFKDFCKRFGYQSHSVILNKWKKENLLDHESDRNDRKRSIGRVYVIKADKEFIEVLESKDKSNDDISLIM